MKSVNPRAKPSLRRPLRQRINASFRKFTNKDVVSAFFEDTVAALYAVLTDPLFLVTSAVVFYLITNFKEDITRSPLGTLFKSFLSQEALGVVKEQQNHVLGILVCFPAVLATNPRFRPTAAIAMVAGVLMLPPQHLYVYSVAAFLGLLYLKISRKSSKLFIVAVSAMLVYSQFLAVSPLFPKLVTSTSALESTMTSVLSALQPLVSRRNRLGSYSQTDISEINKLQSLELVKADIPSCFAPAFKPVEDKSVLNLDNIILSMVKSIC